MMRALQSFNVHDIIMHGLLLASAHSTQHAAGSLAHAHSFLCCMGAMYPVSMARLSLTTLFYAILCIAVLCCAILCYATKKSSLGGVSQWCLQWCLSVVSLICVP